jgi:hypothetical protein
MATRTQPKRPINISPFEHLEIMEEGLYWAFWITLALWLVAGIVTFVGLCLAPTWTATYAFPALIEGWTWAGRWTVLVSGLSGLVFGIRHFEGEGVFLVLVSIALLIVKTVIGW